MYISYYVLSLEDMYMMYLQKSESIIPDVQHVISAMNAQCDDIINKYIHIQVADSLNQVKYSQGILYDAYTPV